MKKHKDLSKVIVTISFILYLLLLIWIIVFKVQIDISNLKYIRSINLNPFKANGSVNGMKETTINLFLFIPLGMYLQFFMKNKKYLSILSIMIILFTSFIFEILQYIFHIGVSDITDIIMNTLGGIMGMILMFVFYKLLTKKINSKQLDIAICYLALFIPIAMFCSLLLL